MIRFFKKIRSTPFLLVFVLLISACNKTLPLRVEKPNDNLMFVLPDRYRNQTIAIQDLTVIKTDCEQNCTMWSLVNFVDDSGELTFSTLKSLKIIYGESFEGLKVSHVPKELISGRYTVGGTAVFIGDTGVPSGSKILFAEFSLAGSSKILRLE